MRFPIIFIFAVMQFFFSDLFASTKNLEHPRELFYIGTFSENGSLGIYVYDYDRKNHRYDLLQTIISKESPSFSIRVRM